MTGVTNRLLIVIHEKVGDGIELKKPESADGEARAEKGKDGAPDADACL